MEVITLEPSPLTSEAFGAFGDVVELESAAEERSINYGNTVRYHNLATLDVQTNEGTPLVSIFRSTPLQLPVEIKVMERHPLSSQLFYPLSRNPYLVVVAPPGEFHPGELSAFVANPDQGVNYHAGTWHHYSLALNEVSDFLVIDRDGPEKNCDEIFLKEKRCFVRYDHK